MREHAIDRIMELTEQDAHRVDGGGIAYTVVEPSGFFKDYERIFRCHDCESALDLLIVFIRQCSAVQ